MSFDGFVTRSVTDELRRKLTDGKIDKVYQPEKEEIILSVRTREGSYKLLLSASAANPRIHLTNVQRENPMTPPMLCMLMRKHLCGAVIKDIYQNGFDRVVRIDAETRNELGDLCTRSVVIEIMGRHSNVILLDDTDRIMDSAKHIDFTVSAVRQVLPGMTYELPPGQDKIAADKLSSYDMMEALAAYPDDTLLDKFLLSKIMGMSPLLAREIVYRFSKNTKMMKCEVDCAAFTVHTIDILKKLCSHEFKPSLVTDPKEKKPVAFSCIKLCQYEDACKVEEFDSISEVVDSYYETRSRREHMNRRSAALLKLVHNNIERCRKKIVMHKEHIESAKDRDKYKMYGDLLTANLYKIKYGDKSVVVKNYYSENGEDIEIKLKADISPSQNAQKLYKRYNKAKTTEKFAKEQLKIAEDEKYYLESVAEAIENADAPAELDEIRQELVSEGYIAKQGDLKKKKQQQKKSEPMKFISPDGYEILVGRNNRQNDELTLKSAYSTDLWFHTKEIPGSHTIVRTKGSGEAPEATMRRAAELAAFYSKARNSSQVPVDYTLIKNVKKPNGAKPGMVIYDRYNTVYVTPNEE